MTIEIKIDGEEIAPAEMTSAQKQAVVKHIMPHVTPNYRQRWIDKLQKQPAED